jgi:putative spermidine/putrescine transport system permease protein
LNKNLFQCILSLRIEVRVLNMEEIVVHSMVRRALSFSLGALYFSYILAPIFLILVGSLGAKWFGTLLPEGFTWSWYLDLFSQPMYMDALKRSLLVAFLTVVGNAFISLPAVYAVHVLDRPVLRSIFNFTILLPVAIPPVVMGLGMIQAFNWPGMALIGTWQLLVAAHMVYTLPFMLRPLMANMDLINWKTLEEAGFSLGAGTMVMMRRVLVPNLLPGLISGALMTFAMSLGEFQLSVMLTGSQSQTYPVVLYQAFYVSTGFACAATTILAGLSLFSLFCVLGLGALFGKSGHEQTLLGS